MTKLSLTLFLIFLFLYGCFSSSGWDRRYDYSVHLSLENPSPETYQQHVEYLQKMIAYFEKEQLKPPPGICAECALYLGRLQRMQECYQYLEKEIFYYPEYQEFIKILHNLHSKPLEKLQEKK